MTLSEKQDSKGGAVIETNDSSRSLEQPQEGLINASGHVQELQRQFSLLSLCSVAITTGNTWVAIGGGIVSRWLVSRRRFKILIQPQVIAIYNGGPPGVIYEL